MKWTIGMLTALALSACTGAATDSLPTPSTRNEGGADPTDPAYTQENEPVRLELEDYGPAPELQNDVWLNTDGPLRLADLRGKVVLLEMWTFG